MYGMSTHTVHIACFLGAAILHMTTNEALGELRVKAMSFNIRYGTAKDGDDVWPNRKQLVFDVIGDSRADFCGLQEALRFQLDEILEAVDAYGECGVGRDDGKAAGEFSAILYRKDRWKLDHTETRWLSDTPAVPNSKHWGNTISRIVTWGRFSERSTGETVYVFNTHFDHRSQPSRVKSGQAVAKLVAASGSDDHVIVMGDLNTGEDNAAVKAIMGGQRKLVDSFRVIHPDAQGVGTFNGFRGRSDGEKIDYVFVPHNADVIGANILRVHTDSKYPSDHFPVTAEVVFAAD